MEVILLTDVEKVGLRGEVVNVARGYMRNYLQPRGLAEVATPERVAELERRGARRARPEARSVEHAQEIAETLRKTVLRFEMNAGPRGRLFGSVTPTDITDEIWRARKIRVDRRKVDLPETIKRVGRSEPVTESCEHGGQRQGQETGNQETLGDLAPVPQPERSWVAL
jgi:large subunit ribosomal protein L9